MDLIYLDPPFNSKRIYNAPLGSKAAGAKFDDTWTMDSVKREWAELMEAADPAVHHTVVGAGLSHSESMQAYLSFMAPRLIEMHRVLAMSGSIYLHCDDTAAAYLKQILDCVFGGHRFENEIVWLREIGTKNNASRFPRNTDRMLFYGRSARRIWHRPTTERSDEQTDKWYTLEDERGRFMRRQLQNPSTEGLADWRGLRHGTGSWNAPRTGKTAEWIEREFIPGYRAIDDVAERLESLDAAGLLHWPERAGGIPSLKKYLEFADTAVPVGDVWTDMTGGRGMPKTERTGWPTQKPLALLHRIIEASSEEGDVVLDPFCGCGTACIAAEQLDRQWAGIDIDSRAEEVTRDRLAREAGEGTLFAHPVTVTDRPPVRTDDEAPQRTPNSVLRAMLWAHLDADRSILIDGCSSIRRPERFRFACAAFLVVRPNGRCACGALAFVVDLSGCHVRSFRCCLAGGSPLLILSVALLVVRGLPWSSFWAMPLTSSPRHDSGRLVPVTFLAVRLVEGSLPVAGSPDACVRGIYRDDMHSMLV